MRARERARERVRVRVRDRRMSKNGERGVVSEEMILKWEGVRQI